MYPLFKTNAFLTALCVDDYVLNERMSYNMLFDEYPRILR